jgi:hypothetical protein
MHRMHRMHPQHLLARGYIRVFGVKTGTGWTQLQPKGQTAARRWPPRAAQNAA